MTEALIVTDKNGEVVIFNKTARQLLGVSDEEPVTKAFLEGIIKKIGLEKAYEESLIMHRDEITKNLVLEEPERIDLLCNLQAIKDKEGAFSGTLTLIRNITKEHQAEKAKSSFVASISHELRTPLTAMGEFISIILDGIPGKLNPKQREYLTVISDNIDRMTRIVARLLDMANIETKKIELKREIANIGDLVNSVATFFRSKAEGKHILLNTTFEGVLPNLYLDKDTIIQVLVNLIDNAIKFTDYWGKIQLGIIEKDGEVEISVSDSGIGITEENQKIIFDKFRQVDQSFGPGAKGVGLGLSICRDLVEMHKGRMWVASEQGKGSVFRFTLPKHSEEMLLKEYLIDAVNTARTDHKPLSFLVLDIDNYWDVETKLGNPIAQKVLKDIGWALKGAVRTHDMVAVYKRKKAIAVLSNMNKKAATEVERRVRSSIDTSNFEWRGREPKPNIVMRMITYPDDAASAREILSKTGGE
ncbi:MAG: ATP-binding protein [Candidatus Omnitrophota bacterium]